MLSDVLVTLFSSPPLLSLLVSSPLSLLQPMGNNCGEWSTKFPPLCHCRSPSAPSAVVVRRVDSAFAARDGNMQLAVWLEQPGTKGGPPTSQAFEDEPTNGIKAASKTIDSPGSINIIIACRTRDASPESPSRFPLRHVCGRRRRELPVYHDLDLCPITLITRQGGSIDPLPLSKEERGRYRRSQHSRAFYEGIWQRNGDGWSPCDAVDLGDELSYCSARRRLL